MFGTAATVRVRCEPAAVSAGEEIVCYVDLGEVDRRARRARVEIGYENVYLEPVEHDNDSDSTFHGYGMSSTQETSAWVPVDCVPLPGEPPSSGTYDVRLRVPPDAPPTVPGAVEWQVRAILDRHHARDARGEARLVVAGSSARLAHFAATPPESTGDTTIDVNVPTRAVHPGETITGSLTVNPSSELRVDGLQVRLVRQRRTYADSGTHREPAHHLSGFAVTWRSNVGTTTVVEASRVASENVCGECTLHPGNRVTESFAITVPVDSTPTFEAEFSSQHWYLQAVLDRPLHRDDMTQLEILLTAPVETAPASA